MEIHNSQHGKINKKNGFTIIEILIGFSIMAVILLLGMTLTGLVNRYSKRSRSRLIRRTGFTHVLTGIEKIMRGVSPPQLGKKAGVWELISTNQVMIISNHHGEKMVSFFYKRKRNKNSKLLLKIKGSAAIAIVNGEKRYPLLMKMVVNQKGGKKIFWFSRSAFQGRK